MAAHKTSELEARFEQAWVELFPNIDLHSQHRFHRTRRWRFDYAAIDTRIAIEIQGGIWTYGGHSRGSGQVRDMEKHNAAAALNWRIFFLHVDTVEDVEALTQIANTIRASDPVC
jgi:hypothetical protein